MWNIHKDTSRHVKYVLALAVGIVCLVLYPMWPYELKLAAYFVVFSLLMALIGLIVVRYIVYIVMWSLGWSCWICPNLFDDSRGLINSFLPFWTSRHRGDGWAFVAFRLVVSLLLAYATYHYMVNGFDPEELKSMVVDSFDWGKDKIVGNGTNQLQVKGGHGKYGSIDDILKMTEEEEEREAEFQRQEEEAQRAEAEREAKEEETDL